MVKKCFLRPSIWVPKQSNKVIFRAHFLTHRRRLTATASALSPHSCRTSQIPGDQKQASNAVKSDNLIENSHKNDGYSSYVHLLNSLLKLPHWQEGPPTKAHKPGALCPHANHANPHQRAKISLYLLTGTRCSADHSLNQSVCSTVGRLTGEKQRSRKYDCLNAKQKSGVPTESGS